MSNQQRPRGRSRGNSTSQRPNQPSNAGQSAANSPTSTPQVGNAASTVQPKESSNLREMLGAGPARPSGHRLIGDIVPIWAIVLVFAVINLLVLFLSYGTFARNMDVYLTRYYQRTKQWDKAIAKIQTNIATYSDMATSPTPLGELANAYFTKGDYANAMKYFLLAQTHRQNIPQGDEGRSFAVTEFSPVLAMCAWRTGNKADAEKYARAALASNKTDPYANYVLGELEYTKGNLRGSVQYYKVVANNPTFKADVAKRYSEIEDQLFKSL